MLDRLHQRRRASADHERRRRAVRQRRYRQNHHAGIKTYPVPLPDAVVEVLFAWHWFDGLDPRDNRALARAIAREITRSTKA